MLLALTSRCMKPKSCAALRALSTISVIRPRYRHHEACSVSVYISISSFMSIARCPDGCIDPPAASTSNGLAALSISIWASPQAIHSRTRQCLEKPYLSSFPTPSNCQGKAIRTNHIIFKGPCSKYCPVYKCPPPAYHLHHIRAF